MLSRAHSRAFTLIELMIAMAIVGITLMAGLPLLKSWSQNMQVRASAEATLNGLQYARAEALKRNTTVRFTLMTTADNNCAVSTGQTNWVVNLGTSLTNDPSSECGKTITPGITQNSSAATYSPYLLKVYAATGAGNVNVASTGTVGNMLVVFDQFGKVQYPTVDTQWVFSYPSAGACATSSADGVVCMNVLISTNGRMRMCNPILPSGSPQGC
ncbi:MAG TPA: GspH/FimT family pseudopilin [Burkholderiaceae bacterium]